MSGWLDPYLDPSPASGLAGLFDLSGAVTFIDESLRAAGYLASSGPVPPMPAPPPKPPPRVLPIGASASPASWLSPTPSALSVPSTSSGGSRPMALDLNSIVAAVSTVGDKVVAFRKADADANLARARLDADARLSEVAIRSGSSVPLAGGLGGVLGSMLPWLGLGLGAVVLLKVVKAVR